SGPLPSPPAPQPLHPVFSADKMTDTDQAFHSLMESRCSRLNQHDELLKALSDSNNAFNQMSQLTSQFSAFVSQLGPSPSGAQAPTSSASSVSNPVQTPNSVAACEPFVPTPERYSGELSSCRAFLTQVSLVFEVQPLSYSSERLKIAYLLSGGARDWGASIWEGQSRCCYSYQLFVTEMKKVFDHPLHGREAADRLGSLKQGGKSVADYSVEFRTLAAESGWKEVALQSAFYRGLNDALKDKLSTRDDTADLDGLMSESCNRGSVVFHEVACDVRCLRPVYGVDCPAPALRIVIGCLSFIFPTFVGIIFGTGKKSCHVGAGQVSHDKLAPNRICPIGEINECLLLGTT
uniref:Retrotransposon gag domain-containing protein n=1 Tax=Stegastes partitus TaxID=144197 RepID=A0A3B5AA76_9TELE